MIRYFKMKKKEITLKLTLYSVIEKVITEKDGIANTITNLYLSIKDTPVNELQDKFIMELAQIVHNDIHAENE